MEELVERLIDKQYSISSIESLTAGLFAAKLAEVAGASQVLRGGLVTYQTQSKIEVLKVSSKLIQDYGVVSKECAQAMVIQGHKMFNTDIVVSFTGNAGPEALESKPVGLVFMSVWFRGKIETYEHIFTGDRQRIRNQVCAFMSERLYELIV